MTGLIAAEIRKLGTVRSTWILTLIGWVMVALSVTVLVFGGLGGTFTGEPSQVADAVAATGGGNSILVLVVGLLSMTTEFRHGTVGRTFQITPSRTRVLVAKLLAGAAYALVFLVGALVVVGLLLLLGVLVNDASLAVDGGVAEVAWQSLVGAVLTVLLGVGFGALVRAQVVAIVVALVWIFVVENAVAAWLPGIGRWLPFQALNGLFVPEAAVAQMPGGFVPLAGFTALVVFAAWVVTFTSLAGVLLRYRDV